MIKKNCLKVTLLICIFSFTLLFSSIGTIMSQASIGKNNTLDSQIADEEIFGAEKISRSSANFIINNSNMPKEDKVKLNNLVLNNPAPVNTEVVNESWANALTENYKNTPTWLSLFSKYTNKNLEQLYTVNSTSVTIKDYELSEHNFYNNSLNKIVTPGGDGFSGSWNNKNIDNVLAVKGTTENPFYITSAQELAFFAYFSRLDITGSEYSSYATTKPIDGMHFQLTENIDLKDFIWIPINIAFDKNINVSFDGGNKTISNLYYHNSYSKVSTLGSGLFEKFSAGEIKNLYMENVCVINTGNGSQYRVAGVIGYGNFVEVNNVHIKNLYLQGANAAGITGWYNSGVVGGAQNCTVNNIYITATTYAGGITDFTSDSTLNNPINNCIVGTGKIISANNSAGGIYGYSQFMRATNCINFAEVSSSTHAGGIAGQSHLYTADETSNSLIQNNYNFGNVTGKNAGGIVGFGSSNAGIVNNYNAGTIESVGGSAGGIIGNASNNRVRNNINFGDVIISRFGDSTYAGGIAGSYSNSTVIFNNINAGNVYDIDRTSNITNSWGKSGNIIGGVTNYPYALSNAYIYDEETNKGQTSLQISTGLKVYNNYTLMTETNKQNILNTTTGYNGFTRDDMNSNVSNTSRPLSNARSEQFPYYYKFDANGYVVTIKTDFCPEFKVKLNQSQWASKEIYAKKVASTFRNNLCLERDDFYKVYATTITVGGKAYNVSKFTNFYDQNRDSNIVEVLTDMPVSSTWILNEEKQPSTFSNSETKTIMFDANGASGVVPLPRTASSTNNFIVPSGNTLYKDGYVFDSWTENANGTNNTTNIYEVGTEPNLANYPSSALVLYAKFKAIQYQVVWASTPEISTESIVTEKDVTINGLSMDVNSRLKTVKTSGSASAKFLGFQVKRNITTETWQNLGIGEKNEDTHILNINSFFNASFINEFVDSAGKIYIKAVYSDISFTLTNGDFSNGVVKVNNIDFKNLTFEKDSVISISAISKSYYEFEKLELATDLGVTKTILPTTEGVVMDAKDNAHFNIILENSYEIKAYFKLKDYNIVLQNLNNKGDIINHNYVFNSGSTTFNLDDHLTGAYALTSIEGYRFLKWRHLNGDTIDSTNGVISAIELNYKFIDKYLGVGNTLILTAVYQTQYNLSIMSLSNHGSYEVSYVNEYGISTVINNANYLYIDEGGIVKITIAPHVGYQLFNVQGTLGNEVNGNEISVFINAERQIYFDYEVSQILIKQQNIDTNGNILSSSISKDNLTATISGVTQLINSSYATIDDELLVSLNLNSQPHLYRFLHVKLVSRQNNEDRILFDSLNGNSSLFMKDSTYDFVNLNNELIFVVVYVKQFVVNVSDLSESAGFGNIEVLYKNENASEDASYTTASDLTVFDINTKIKIIATENKYYWFKSFSGALKSEISNNEVMFTLLNNREVSIIFDKIDYNLNILLSGTNNGNINAASSKIKIDEDLVLSFNPKGSYEINNWKINGKNITDYSNIKLNNNTLVIAMTKDFLDILTFDGDSLTISNNIITIMNPLLFYGLIFGTLFSLITSAFITILIIKNKKRKKEQKAMENKLKELSVKFNISDVISDLKK